MDLIDPLNDGSILEAIVFRDQLEITVDGRSDCRIDLRHPDTRHQFHIGVSIDVVPHLYPRKCTRRHEALEGEMRILRKIADNGPDLEIIISCGDRLSY